MARKTNQRMVAQPVAGKNAWAFTVVDTEGQQVSGYSQVVASLDMIPAELFNQLAMHGLKQKVADAAAIPRDAHGQSASWSTKLDAMQEVINNLYNGEWSSRGTGGGSPQGLLFTAFCRLYPDVAVDSIKEKIEGMDRATQAKMRKVPKVAAMIETIKAERAENGDDAEAIGDDDVDAMIADL